MNREIVNKITGAAKEAAGGEDENGKKAPKNAVSSADAKAMADESFQCSIFSGKQQDCLTADNADGTGMGEEGIKKSEAEPNIEQPPSTGSGQAASNAEHRIKRIGALKLRPYQKDVFWDHSSGVVVLHWSRQIGKSFVLAAWAVYRLMTRPGRLVTVLSNSRENGAEFLLKCAEVCRIQGARYETVMSPPKLDFEDMRMELRLRYMGQWGRIKVLAANPRTARGFSGDLILDEFAFHENGQAVWEAAEPILASNKDFLCRIASTGNGRHNLFYRMAERGEGQSSNDQGKEIKNEKLKVKNGEAESLTADNADGAAMETGGIKKLEAEPNIEHRTSNAQHRIGEGDDCAMGGVARCENATASGDVDWYLEEVAVAGSDFEFRRVYTGAKGKEAGAQSSNDQGEAIKNEN